MFTAPERNSYLRGLRNPAIGALHAVDRMIIAQESLVRTAGLEAT
jgi:hypothetical protein